MITFSPWDKTTPRQQRLLKGRATMPKGPEPANLAVDDHFPKLVGTFESGGNFAMRDHSATQRRVRRPLAAGGSLLTMERGTVHFSDAPTVPGLLHGGYFRQLYEQRS